jgi:dTDP-4-amino-4,6-dideoxygalactose transaminase
MDVLLDVGGKRGVALIEDAAQAIDATHEGRPAGVIGDLGCLSFYPTKNLGGFGEGGFVFANRADLGGVVRQLRNHGESKRYVHERVGGNFRLDTMKAAILLVKLTHLDDFTARRQRHAERYDDLLGGTPVTTPFVAAGRRHVYHQYSILCDRRDALAAFLRERGVQTGIYYPIPLHLQPCFAHLGYREGSLPVSEGVAKRILSLPCHPMLGDEDAAYVASCIHEFFGTVLPTRRTGAVAGHR